MVGITKILIGSAAFVATAHGTNIHVNTGCITIDGTPVCGPNSISNDAGAARFFAGFDSSNTAELSSPSCELDAIWPTNYGDIYFGADDCLYDAQGINIGGQCCVDGSAGSVQVNNPYYKP